MNEACNHPRPSGCCSGQCQPSPDGKDWSDQPPPDDDGLWADWPCCPQCGHRRQTLCPTCELGGNDFVLAEFIPAAAPVEPSRSDTDSGEPAPAAQPDSILLMCPSCDEAFAPQFYRRCQQCGYQFADGVEMETPAARELSGRAVLVLMSLAALAVAGLAYLWYLFR